MKGLIPGRIVHAIIPLQAGTIERPAIVVKVWNQDTGCCNLQAFTDGLNDKAVGDEAAKTGTLWCTSYVYSEEHKPVTWHCPERD